MKKFYIPIYLSMYIVMQCSFVFMPWYSCCAKDEREIYEMFSPDRTSALKLSPSLNGMSILTIYRNSERIGHYDIDGELLSAFWNPSGTFVAINNHNGHGGYYVWIISLKDGKIITSHGSQGEGYKRYEDERYGPDLYKMSKEDVQRSFPNLVWDGVREGYDSYVAYKWKDDYKLLVYTEYIFEQLAKQQNSSVQVRAVFFVNEEELKSVELKTLIVKDQDSEMLSSDVKEAYGY